MLDHRGDLLVVPCQGHVEIHSGGPLRVDPLRDLHQLTDANAACPCKCSRSEGSLDSQSLFGRLGWLEQTANPSPLGSQGDSVPASKVGGNGKFSPVSTQAALKSPCRTFDAALHERSLLAVHYPATPAPKLAAILAED